MTDRGDKYECAMCHNTYTTDISDEEALDECEGLWGELPPEELEIVCDDCWQKIHPQRN